MTHVSNIHTIYSNKIFTHKNHFFFLLVIKDLQSQDIFINITAKLEQFLKDANQIDQVFHDEKLISCGSWAG